MAHAFDPDSRPSTTGGSSKHGKVIADVHDPLVNDEEALTIYRWLDSLQFSRSKKTSANRDFADGVMMAELVAHHIPKIINATYYVPASASSKKIVNWEHLNSNVFKRIGFQLTPDLIGELAAAKPGMIERVLIRIRPILLKGSKAVLPFSKRLGNIKPRFMDFEKTYLKNKERPKTTDTYEPRTASRPHSAGPSRGKSPLRPTAPPPSATEVEPEVEVIKNPKPSRCSRKNQKRLRSNSLSGGTFQPETPAGLVSGGNYNIFTRPSTGEKSSTSAPSPTDIFTGISNLKIQLEQERSENPGATIVSSNKRGIPVRSSWIPVEGEEDESTETERSSQNDNKDFSDLLPENEETNGSQVVVANNNSEGITGNNNEEEADIEIYCEQSGYEEDTENDDEDFTDVEGDFDENHIFSLPGGMTRSTRKRKLKRVIKYEYREEYILNGMGSIQLPNSEQLEKVRRDYMNPGNKDPNCRGYGFV